MFEIAIDTDVCKKDGLCAMTCMRNIFQQEEKATIPRIVDSEFCYGCGQCVAICPQNAISHSGFPEGTVNSIKSEYLPNYEQVLELIRSRRSKRLFKDKAVERSVIEKVLEAARFAPSGHNEQTTEFVVVQSKEIVHEIGALTAKGIKKEAQQYQNPIAKTIMRMTIGQRKAAYVAGIASELGGLASLFDSGKDWIVREAPVLILFCADTAGEFFARVNANLALHNAALAIESLGLGCFYAGFVVLASDRSNSIAKLVGLPETHNIYGALAMGYPRLKFRKWMERNPAKVTWVGAE